MRGEAFGVGCQRACWAEGGAGGVPLFSWGRLLA